MQGQAHTFKNVLVLRSRWGYETLAGCASQGHETESSMLNTFLVVILGDIQSAQQKKVNRKCRWAKCLSRF